MVKKLLIVLAVFNLFFAATLPLFADVSTTATVPPKTANFQFDFTSNDSGNTFPKQQILTYTITYGASSSAIFATATTLTADFSNDTINGIHILDYVFGSASHAYQNASPVVDLTARKITWTIPALPAGVVDQKVTFQLKTNSDYSGTTPVHFSVKALMSNQYVAFPEQNIYQTLDPNYQPPQQQSTITTPTPTPLPSLTPPAPPTVAINDVFFNTIEDSKAEVSVHTTLPSKITIFYGTTYSSFSQAVATGDYAAFTITLLDNLKPNTIYYARITAVDRNGNKATSDIFTFKTAAIPPAVSVDKSIAILTSEGNLLSTVTQGITQHTSSQTILPNTARYEITYSLPQSTQVKDIDIILRNKHVLGINTYAHAEESNMITAPMIEKQPGVYYVELPPIPLPGEYEMYARVIETTGNIYEQKVSEIKISLPLHVLEKKTNSPIGDARVYFYLYNPRTHAYEPLQDEYSKIKNPGYSDKDGFVHTVLPNGTYKITVASLFHRPQTIEFTLQTGGSYPTVYLEKTPYSIMSITQYISNGFFDFGASVNTYIASLATSTQNFNILAALIVFFSIIVAGILFRLRVGLSFKHLAIAFYHHVHHTMLPFQQAIIFGKVSAANGTPLSGVEVYALTDDEKVLFHTTTNRQGLFSYKRQKGATHYHFLQQGYEQLNIPIVDGTNIKVILAQNVDFASVTRKKITQSIEQIGGLFFEACLILSLLLEVSFMHYFGFVQALPFFILSLTNIMLWIFFIKQSRTIV